MFEESNILFFKPHQNQRYYPGKRLPKKFTPDIPVGV